MQERHLCHIGAIWQTGIIQAHLPNYKAERPPHPERLLEALLANVCTREDQGVAHRIAIEALEGQAPEISITPAMGNGTQLYRYGRYTESEPKDTWENTCGFYNMPVIVHDSLHVVYSYEIEDLKAKALIEEALAEVFYLGEATSAVTLKFVPEIPKHFLRYKPSRYGDTFHLRIPQPGRTKLLQDSYARRMRGVLEAKNPGLAHRLMNEYREINDLVAEVGYYNAQDKVDAGWHMVPVLLGEPLERVDGRDFERFIADYRSVWMDSLRDAQNAPAELVGHDRDGTPTKLPHVGFAPLFDVGRPHADGALQGIAVLIPKNISQNFKDEAFAAVNNTFNVRVSDGARRISLLNPKTYEASSGKTAPKLRVANRMTRASRHWATITPAVPFRFFKTKNGQPHSDAERNVILELFERAGLPVPISIRWGPSNTVTGSVHVNSLKRLPHDKNGRRLTLPRHLEFEFDCAVQGPIALGRRAWKGYGICLPLYS